MNFAFGPLLLWLPVLFQPLAFPETLLPAPDRVGPRVAGPRRVCSEAPTPPRFRCSWPSVERSLPGVFADSPDLLLRRTPTLCETICALVQDQPTKERQRFALACVLATSDR